MGRLVITIIGFILAIALFFFYTKPAYDQVQALQGQVAQYNAALDKATQLQQLKATLLSRYNSFDPNNLSRLQTLLPDQVNNIGLILDLDSMAGRYGLALENVDVSTPTTASPGQNSISAIGTSNQQYSSLTLSFGTTGTYGSFVQFLTDLETSLRIVDVTSLTIAPSAQGGKATTAQDPLYDFKMTLRTYWLKP